jgi:AraC family transcriptional regulator
MEKDLILNYSQKNSSLQIFSDTPIISSWEAGWNNINLEYHQHSAHEVPECKPIQNIIVIFNNSYTRVFERQLDGRFQTEYVKKGDIVISPANVLHKASWHENIEFILIIIEPALIARTASEFNHSSNIEIIPHFAQPDSLIHQIGLQLKSELETNNNESVSRLYADRAAHLLAVHMLQHYSTRKQPIKKYTDGLPKRKLKQVMDYITCHLEQDFGLAELAELVHMSPSYFGSQFKQSTGLTPHQYLIKYRLSEARRLLANTNLTIEEIAQRTGFSNHSHLTRNFRKHMSITPYTYRQML